MRKCVCCLFIFFFLIPVMSPASAGAAGNEIRIFIWSEYMDEINMPRAFEKATGIRARLDMYESNEEMMAKLQAGGAGQYDIIVPSDYIIPSLIKLGLVRRLDHSRLPNLKNLGTRFRKVSFDPGNLYSVGWQWGTVGLMYDKTRLPDSAASSWSVVFDPEKDFGPFWLIDGVREMMGAALLYMGRDFNSVDPGDLKAAADLLVKTKKRKSCLGFKGGVGGKNDVVAGVAAAAIVYNGDAVKAIAEDPKRLGFAVPKEGSEIWLDSMCVPAKAPNPDGAHQWINWILDPEVGAALSNYNHYATPNEAAIPYLDKKDRENPGVWPPPEVMGTLVFTMDLGRDNRLMDQAWTRAKSN
ncbi:Putrescine-binding periplasmic protein [Candidatus Desulfarcum epimagneticum]|uniref:Putrescine-binding periplasmic protein n=1 Tax=uncultured Desulfobacteraceae bacterium TaxID=218296 RepID=A0A484HDE9_9BACT|nr:Putrescine-binding periplasmic protein [uncultured Desulfobacteraceae bacterium]